MIWITGDKHGLIDPFEDNPGYRKLKRDDTLIICGDFGFIWDNSPAEKRNLKWLSKRKFQIAFIEGCNDNYDLLKEYPLEEWNGGMVRRICENIVWMQRGEMFTIEGQKVLAFGGGFTLNKDEDLKGKSWWPQEAPNNGEIDKSIESIKKAKGNFDLIVSHEAPYSIRTCFDVDPAEYDIIHDVLEEIRTHTNFRKWFFGKHHVDKIIPPSYYAVFDDMILFE